MRHILLICFLFLGYNLKAQDINIDPNQKAKLYFTEAEKRFNQNDFKTALEYIEKAEYELGESNGRILNLKIKTLYNYGKFEQAQQALALFIDKYSSSVTPEMRAETEGYFIKLERYLEKKQEEEERRAEERRKKEESLKYYSYVGCPNSLCSSGKVNKYHKEHCWNCDGTGKITKYNYAQAFANGLNGTNKNAAYKVTCSDCRGSGKINKTRKVTCSTCKGRNKVLKYVGSYRLSSDEQEYAIRNKRKQIDYYIDLRSRIKRSGDQKFFPVKDFDSSKYGFVDRNLSLITPYRYDGVEVLSGNLAVVTANSKSGLLNNNNEIILPLEYTAIRKLSNNSLLVKKATKWYVSDLKGNKKSGNIDGFFTYGDALVVFKNNSKYGIMDFNGQIIKEAVYDEAEVINSKPLLIAFKSENSWKLLQLTTSVKDLYGVSFDNIRTYKSGGDKVIELAGSSSKLAKVDGSLISNDEFSDVNFNGDLGMFILKSGGRYGLYDIAHDSYVSPKYSALVLNSNNPHRALVMSNGLFGVIDSREKIIIPVSKPRVWFNTGENRFIVQEKEKSKKRFVYDTNGNLLYDYKDKNK